MVLRPVFPASETSGRILLVGARSTLVGHLREMLRGVGYSVEFASERPEWQYILSSCGAAILVDSRRFWFSEKIFDICSAIRDGCPDIPIMVVGPNDLESKVRLFNIGADDYLLDPVDPQEFLARIRVLIRRQAEKDWFVSGGTANSSSGSTCTRTSDICGSVLSTSASTLWAIRWPSRTDSWPFTTTWRST